MQKILAISAVCAVSAAAFAQDEKPAAKNIILLIGDGMGFNQVLAGDYYQHGETGKQVYQGWTTYAMSTYAFNGEYTPEKSGDFEYLKKGANDSAATASTMATGVATYRGAISLGPPPDREELFRITDLAEEEGKSTGVVSSVLFNHATPASFLAHNRSRNNYDEISNDMLVESAAEVIMGAGHPAYDKDGNPVETHEGDPDLEIESSFARLGGKQVWDNLQAGTLGADADGDGEADPWTFIDAKGDFQQLTEGETPQRVFGLAPVATTLQLERSGDPEVAPYTDPFIETVPSLETMTLGALNILDNNDNGFFLMVEGGAIDWAGHANVAGRMVEEQIAFNDAIAAVAEWVEENSSWDETLVIVTADHECGYVLGPESGADADPQLKPVINNGKGKQPGFEFYSTGHTNQLVPLYVKGPGETLFAHRIVDTDPKHGKYVHNAAVGKVMFDVLK